MCLARCGVGGERIGFGLYQSCWNRGSVGCTSEVHPVFNPVAPYGYLLPNMYLFIAVITNPDSFVRCCRTWMSLDITRFCENQRQPSSGSQLGAGRFDTICTAVCDRCDSSTACSHDLLFFSSINLSTSLVPSCMVVLRNGLFEYGFLYIL